VGDGSFQLPTECTPLNQSQKKLVTGDYVGDSCAKFGANPYAGASEEMDEIELKF